MAATESSVMGYALLVLLLLGSGKAMNTCETQSAICTFNGRLQGAILFQEKHGFGCSSFGDDKGLHIQIDLRGFDPNDGVSAHNFRIKSYAGLQPNCTGMGQDYGQGLRIPDLGTFAEQNGLVQVSDAVLQNGPTIIGQESIVGRSIAVYKGQNNRFQQATEVLGCCIIGLANFQQLQPLSPSSGYQNPAASNNGFQNPTAANNGFPNPTATNGFQNPTAGNNGFQNTAAANNGFQNPTANTGFQNTAATTNAFPNPTSGFPSPTAPSFNSNNNLLGGGNSGGVVRSTTSNNNNNNNFNSDPFGSTGIRKQSANTRLSPQSLTNSFTNSAFRSPFGLDDKFSFFDLSGKTSKVNSVLPDNIQDKFEAPEPPRFQDIYGLDTGESPLGKSGYGNAVRPDKGSALSKNFFADEDVLSTVGMGLSAEEMDIPRESGDEEATTSYHEDKAVEKDPGFNPDSVNPGNYDDAPPPKSSSSSSSAKSGSAPSRFDVPEAAGSLPPGFGGTDLKKASFLPTGGKSFDDDSRDNINITQTYHNGGSTKNQLSNSGAEGDKTTSDYNPEYYYTDYPDAGVDDSGPGGSYNAGGAPPNPGGKPLGSGASTGNAAAGGSYNPPSTSKSANSPPSPGSVPANVPPPGSVSASLGSVPASRGSVPANSPPPVDGYDVAPGASPGGALSAGTGAGKSKTPVNAAGSAGGVAPGPAIEIAFGDTTA